MRAFCEGRQGHTVCLALGMLPQCRPRNVRVSVAMQPLQCESQLPSALAQLHVS